MAGIARCAGSGKTLAYLAPLAQALRAQEAAGGRGMAPKAPRALVLAPTSELCVQVGCRLFLLWAVRGVRLPAWLS